MVKTPLFAEGAGSQVACNKLFAMAAISGDAGGDPVDEPGSQDSDDRPLVQAKVETDDDNDEIFSEAGEMKFDSCDEGLEEEASGDEKKEEAEEDERRFEDIDEEWKTFNARQEARDEDTEGGPMSKYITRATKIHEAIDDNDNDALMTELGLAGVKLTRENLKRVESALADTKYELDQGYLESTMQAAGAGGTAGRPSINMELLDGEKKQRYKKLMEASAQPNGPDPSGTVGVWFRDRLKVDTELNEKVKAAKGNRDVMTNLRKQFLSAMS